MNNGILIDTKFCTGCHACEVACKQEKNLPDGVWGIKILELGPWQLPNSKKWEYRYLPMLAKSCDLCEERVRGGQLPSCVFHCPASVMTYGPLVELSKQMDELGEMALIQMP